MFNIPGRGGIIATGTILQGEINEIKGGMTLQDEATGKPVRILAVEFRTPKARQENLTALVIDRKDQDLIKTGSVLVSQD